MALYGNLSTFPVTDLLQWVENARKSGILEVERNHVNKCMVFRTGRVVAVSSNDPPSLLGQVLLARGAIDEATLRAALARQEAEGGNLGAILIASGAVTEGEVLEQIAAKAEETVYSLFDCADAFFQFHEDGEPPRNLIEVDLKIQDVLLRGLKRFDEMRRIRQVFHDPGIVLERTDKPLPASVSSGRVAGRILEAVNGERTLAELLLHARASEYLVSKFLFELYRKCLLRVKGVRKVGDAGSGRAISAAAGPSVENAPEGRPATADGEHDLGAEIDVAQRLLARGENEAALVVLHAASRHWPGAPSIRELITRTESRYTEQVSRDLPPEKVPVVLERADGVEEGSLTPGEAYLLTLVDGVADVKSILWIAPMRTVDVLRSLHGLLAKGAIALHDPAAAA